MGSVPKLRAVSIPVLHVVFPTRRQALENCRSAGKELSFFVPARQAFAVGSAIAVDVSFQDSKGHFLVQGVVTWRREVARGIGQAAGVVVTFQDPANKKKASELFAFCAGRPLGEGTAGSHRTRLSSRCLVRSARAIHEGEFRDISATGAFVALGPVWPPKAGVEVELQINPLFGTFGGKRVGAKVVWVGVKYGVGGCGVRFTSEPEAIRKVLAVLK